MVPVCIRSVSTSFFPGDKFLHDDGIPGPEFSVKPYLQYGSSVPQGIVDQSMNYPGRQGIGKGSDIPAQRVINPGDLRINGRTCRGDHFIQVLPLEVGRTDIHPSVS